MNLIIRYSSKIGDSTRYGHGRHLVSILSSYGELTLETCWLFERYRSLVGVLGRYVQDVIAQRVRDLWQWR